MNNDGNVDWAQFPHTKSVLSRFGYAYAIRTYDLKKKFLITCRLAFIDAPNTIVIGVLYSLIMYASHVAYRENNTNFLDSSGGR